MIELQGYVASEDLRASYHATVGAPEGVAWCIQLKEDAPEYRKAAMIKLAMDVELRGADIFNSFKLGGRCVFEWRTHEATKAVLLIALLHPRYK